MEGALEQGGALVNGLFPFSLFSMNVLLSSFIFFPLFLLFDCPSTSRRGSEAECDAPQQQQDFDSWKHQAKRDQHGEQAVVELFSSFFAALFRTTTTYLIVLRCCASSCIVSSTSPSQVVLFCVSPTQHDSPSQIDASDVEALTEGQTLPMSQWLCCNELRISLPARLLLHCPMFQVGRCAEGQEDE